MARLADDFGGKNLVALCRYDDQLKRVKERFGASYSIPETAVDGAKMIEDSDVFVGMGGTMTTEAALMGVPAVSAFQGSELYTEKFLLSKRLLLKARTATEVSRLVKRSLAPGYAADYGRRARTLLDWMEDPVDRVVAYLESLPLPR